jgi:glutamine amidotransferase
MFAVRAERKVTVREAFAGLRRLSVEHKDGWGIARFDEESPVIETRITPAHECARFETLESELSTRSLLAHIRLASVGTVEASNNHPFFGGGWAFMHNGTLKNFSKHRDRFEKELHPTLRAELKGATDSERCFALFLTFLDGAKAPDLGLVSQSLARVMQVARGICDEGGGAASNESSMNFMLSDGQRLVATRHGRSLWLAKRDGVRFLASEHLWPGESWEEVSEGEVVCVDRGLETSTSRLSSWHSR